MNISQKIWTCLQSLSLLHWLVLAGVGVLSWLVYAWRYARLQCRLAKNLKRKVYFLKTSSSKNLQVEKDLVKGIGLFSVEDDIKDISENLKPMQNLKSKAAFIVGYDPIYSLYKDLIEEAKRKNIPVIVFSEQGEIQNSEHWKIFNGYIYCDVANTSNRLVVILLNILMIV